jgi:hypothetical protein
MDESMRESMVKARCRICGNFCERAGDTICDKDFKEQNDHAIN